MAIAMQENRRTNDGYNKDCDWVCPGCDDCKEVE